MCVWERMKAFIVEDLLPLRRTEICDHSKRSLSHDHHGSIRSRSIIMMFCLNCVISRSEYVR